MSSSFSVDKKLNDQFHRNAKIQKIASKEAKRNLQYLENEPDGYMIPENEIDKTLKVSQDYLKSILPKYNADNIFDLNLEDKAPFYIDYSRNGKYLLLAGEKGNISMLDWRDKNLITEFDTDSTISNIKFLHNETMFAVAQNDMVYIYDKQGIELHALDYLMSPNHLEFLPYHFLLVSALKNNYIKYQDVSIGKIVSEIKTKSGFITSFTQNPSNAIIVSGHSNGLVQMWTPNYGNESVVKIFAHPYSVNAMAVDIDGYTLVTCGNDSRMKIWDLRNAYKEVYEYFNPNIATSLAISQKGLLSVSYGSTVEVWKDYAKSKQKEPYMKHHFKNNRTKTKQMKFVPFEDFLGIGTNIGFSSIIVPGSGIANFDTFENNPYETKNQRKQNEVRDLLEKIPYDMITIDPNMINKTDPRSKKIIEQERKEEAKKRAEEIIAKQKKKLKMRLKNKEKHDEIIKEFNKNQALRGKARAMIELQANQKNEEKTQVKKQVKILQNLADDFDPELYIKEEEEPENAEEIESDSEN